MARVNIEEIIDHLISYVAIGVVELRKELFNLAKNVINRGNGYE